MSGYAAGQLESPGTYRWRGLRVVVPHEVEIAVVPQQESAIPKLSLEILSRFIPLCAPQEVAKLKRVYSQMEDAVFFARILDTFPEEEDQVYLRKMVEGIDFSASPICIPPSAKRQFCCNIASLAKRIEGGFSPAMIPPGKTIAPSTYQKCRDALDWLQERDRVLVDFYIHFLQIHEIPFPSFMEENLNLAEKADRIRRDLAENPYPWEKLREKEQIPPEAVLYLVKEPVEYVAVLSHCYKNDDKTWVPEIASLCFESGKIETALEASDLSKWDDNYLHRFVFKEAVRSSANGVVAIYLRGKDRIEFYLLRECEQIARESDSQEALHLLQEKYKNQRRKLSCCVRFFCCPPRVRSFPIQKTIKPSCAVKMGQTYASAVEQKGSSEETVQERLVNIFEEFLEQSRQATPKWLSSNLTPLEKSIRVRDYLIQKNCKLSRHVVQHRILPLEILHFRMNRSVFHDVMCDAYWGGRNAEALFLLIESEQFAFFQEQDPEFLKGLSQKMLLRAVEKGRISSIKILMRTLQGKLTSEEVEHCRRLANGNREILKLFKPTFFWQS